jgi:hypothetical protein
LKYFIYSYIFKFRSDAEFYLKNIRGTRGLGLGLWCLMSQHHNPNPNPLVPRMFFK